MHGDSKVNQRLTNHHDRAYSHACLIQTDRLAHRRLDDERLDVLPVLLQERDEEVDGKHDVG